MSIPFASPTGPFASPTGRPLVNDEFGHVLGFLAPKDLAEAESVCRSWNQFISTTDQWKKQCQNRLNIPTNMNPMSFLPKECDSYKKGIQLASTKVFNARTYQYYLEAEIEPIPSVLKATPLAKSNEPDPCDPTKTKGQNYIWMDSPSYFKITVDGDFPFELDKPDNPKDEEAPRLIPKEVGLAESFKTKIGLGLEPEKKVLKVPNTINNLGVLFKHPKYGNPSAYGQVFGDLFKQHGNKRIPPGRICMREDVIGKNLTFDQQQAAAKEAGVVVLNDLGHRILFNFIKHAETNTYPDGYNPWTFARTLTLMVDSEGTTWPSGCEGGSLSGLNVNASGIVRDHIGVAVALPAEV